MRIEREKWIGCGLMEKSRWILWLLERKEPLELQELEAPPSRPGSGRNLAARDQPPYGRVSQFELSLRVAF